MNSYRFKKMQGVNGKCDVRFISVHFDVRFISVLFIVLPSCLWLGSGSAGITYGQYIEGKIKGHDNDIKPKFQQ